MGELRRATQWRAKKAKDTQRTTHTAVMRIRAGRASTYGRRALWRERPSWSSGSGPRRSGRSTCAAPCCRIRWRPLPGLGRFVRLCCRVRQAMGCAHQGKNKAPSTILLPGFGEISRYFRVGFSANLQSRFRRRTATRFFGRRSCCQSWNADRTTCLLCLGNLHFDTAVDATDASKTIGRPTQDTPS